jgi:hypothetical protein
VRADFIEKASDESNEPSLESSVLASKPSVEYLGQWHRLVSTTNWEKGRIISSWRGALHDAGAPASSFSDEAWSRAVGSVSPQHVGRLRRVFDRFGQSQHRYTGLYWSHFQAAVDWSDAEMWLEGASRSGWSVSAMRNRRWETLGAPAEMKPRDEDIVNAELDEDAATTELHSPEAPVIIGDEMGVVHPFDADADEESSAGQSRSGMADASDAADAADESDVEAAGEPTRPFENLPSLPPDLSEAFESFKLAILGHKITGWLDVSCRDVIAALEALKQLALAPR